MLESYYIPGKKSILCGLAAVFLLFAQAAMAKEPTDPGYASQAAMWRQIGAPIAWDYTTGSAKVVVAVIDTGLDVGNQDIMNNIWTNEKEIPGNGLDDDHNGYIDDVNGWNFIENNNLISQTAADNESDHDVISHGTAIAGLIGAEANNGIAGVGLNWQIKIMPIRAINNYGSGSYDDIIKAINYAVDNGANVISMSFVGDAPDDQLLDTIRRAYLKGVITVVAAGNNNSEHTNGGDLLANPMYPICFDKFESENWILGVTSVDSKDKLSEFADYGPCVDLSAPGNDIYSLEYYDPSHGWSSGFSGGHYGTSFSVPLVAGSVALLKAIRPEWTTQELIHALLSSADDIDMNNPGYAGQIGYGRLNIGRAIAAAIKEKAAPIDFDIYYYRIGSRLYSFQLSSQKNVFLTDLNESIQFLDSSNLNINKEWKAAAILINGAQASVALIDAKGNIQTSFDLPKGINYRAIRLAAENGDERLVISGYNSGTRKSVFLIYDLSGTKRGEFSAQGETLLFAAADNVIVSAFKSGKRIEFFKFDFAGNKQPGSYVFSGASLDDLVLGNVMSGTDEQAVALVRANQSVTRYVLDFGSSSFMKDNVSGSCNRWHAVLGNADSGPGKEILIYCPSGGKFNVITARGSAIKELELPKLE